MLCFYQLKRSESPNKPRGRTIVSCKNFCPTEKLFTSESQKPLLVIPVENELHCLIGNILAYAYLTIEF